MHLAGSQFLPKFLCRLSLILLWLNFHPQCSAVLCFQAFGYLPPLVLAVLKFSLMWMASLVRCSLISLSVTRMFLLIKVSSDFLIWSFSHHSFPSANRVRRDRAWEAIQVHLEGHLHPDYCLCWIVVCVGIFLLSRGPFYRDVFFDWGHVGQTGGWRWQNTFDIVYFW